MIYNPYKGFQQSDNPHEAIMRYEYYQSMLKKVAAKDKKLTYLYVCERENGFNISLN